MPGVVVAPAPAAHEAGGKARKLTKNEQRRAKKKAQKQEGGTKPATQNGERSATSAESTSVVLDEKQLARPVEPSPDDPIQTVPDVSIDEPSQDDPLYSQFASVFAKFAEDTTVKEEETDERVKAEVFYDDEPDIVPEEDAEDDDKPKMSKKARKKAQKLSIAELKSVVSKPEAVEWTDVSAADPKMLVNIKVSRNVVPVPPHWNLKREYLSSKRGIEKQNFRLPSFIAETGIAELRQSAHDMQAEGTLKQKQRERVNPTLGKFDIDYQKLFEAFFRRQTKPTLTRFGEVYFEGKEFEADLKHLRPGELSDDLREALNMPLGAPPPWLINMQKFGPPPSYPALKVPGVNAPIPYGSRWGLVQGEWGKPPLLDDGTPRWGGTFVPNEGSTQQKSKAPVQQIDRSLWGELQVLEDEEEEEAEDDEEEEAGEDAQEPDTAQIGRDEDIGGLETPFQGTATESAFTQAGTMSVPEGFDIRKQRRGHETEDPAYPRQAGTVLKERSIRNEGFFGGERAYDLSGAEPNGYDDDRSRKRKAGEADNGRMHVDQDDLSRMIAEEDAKRLKRDQDERRRR